MFAVIELGGLQFKVSEGQTIAANRLDYEPGQKITVEKVLMFSDGQEVKIGQPYLKDVEVKAEVVGHTRAPKVIAYHYRKRKDSARTIGHRQDLTTIKIEKIAA